MFSGFSVLVVLLLGFLGVSQVSGSDCTDNPVFTPSTLVVKINDSTQARCDLCKTECHEQLSVNGLEIPVGSQTQISETVWLWSVDRLTEWDINPICFYTANEKQCVTNLPVTVYQPPKSVIFSFMGHAELAKSGDVHTLQCSVFQVAPLRNLLVIFHRGRTTLGRNNTDTDEKMPVDKLFTLSYRLSKEDNGAQFWCEATLKLGPGGPQPPPVVKAEKLTAVVRYGPDLLVSANPDPIQITKGNPLYLNCSAEGNPAPSYTWTSPSSSSSHNGNVFTVKSVGLEHDGEYTCTVSNAVGEVEVKFYVNVKVSPIVYIVAGVAAGVVLICCGALLLYIFYYKPNRMGQYTLKNVFRLRTQHTAVPPKE